MLSETSYVPIDQGLGERIRWFTTLRWFLLTVVTAFVLLGNRWLGNVLPASPLLGTLVAIAGYSLVFWVVAQRLSSRGAPSKRHVLLMQGQTLADLLALTILLHFSGGLENPFSVYYVLLVAVGSIVMTRRASYLYAGIATILWVGLLVTEATGVIPHYNLAGFRSPVRYQQLGHIFAESVVLVIANFGVAYLASNIVERLREGERQLYEANASLEMRAAELARLNERLRELDRTRALFLRLVTHELRAPVAAIQSYLRLILDGYVPDERFQEIIAKAEQRARDQLELISDLLDLARLEEPQSDTPVEPSDAAAILRDVLDMMQVRIEDKALSVEVNTAPAISPVLANEEHVKQVWINLISNAVKYTPDGGHVTITLKEQDDVIYGSVRDTGIGINPEEIEHIFESFYRTEAAKAMTRQGTGLGLSIVAGIMKRYGGRVWLESEIGRGSTFSFEWPKAE